MPTTREMRVIVSWSRTRSLGLRHRVTVADFVCHGHFDNLFIDPENHRTRRRLFLASGYLLDSGGPNTHKWTDALEAATGRTSLGILTLSQFAGVSSFSWLRRRRAWCPHCLSVQVETEPDDLYEPLLWSIRLVSVCPLHTLPLVEICPDCKASTRPFDGLAAPGYCGSCGSPLWIARSAEMALSAPKGTTLYQLWCSVHAALLLEASNEFVIPLLPSSIGRVLAATFGSMMEQSRNAAAHAAGCSKRSSYLWAKGLALPRIETLFRLCFNLGLSPLDLFRKAMFESANAG
jgi:TniQ